MNNGITLFDNIDYNNKNQIDLSLSPEDYVKLPRG